MSISISRILSFSLLAFVLVALLTSPVHAFPRGFISGRITWYDTHSRIDSGGFIGSCGKSIKSGYIKHYPIVAMNPHYLQGGKACGQIIEVVSPAHRHQKMKFVVADECPECDSKHIDLARVGFDKIANDNTGVYNHVKWRFTGKKIRL